MPRPDFMTEDEFPLGDWVGYVRDLHADHELDPADERGDRGDPGLELGRGMKPAAWGSGGTGGTGG